MQASIRILAFGIGLFGFCLAEGQAQAKEEPETPYVTRAPETSEMPWSVRIIFNGENPAACTAIALSPRWLLTSGHCLRGRSVHNTRVSVSAVEANGQARVIVPSSRANFYNHPDYGRLSDRGDDIGLVRLEAPGLFPELSAALFDDPAEPWSWNRNEAPFSPIVYVAGYGRGSGPDGEYDCDADDNTSGTKRLGRLILSGDHDDDGAFGTGPAIAVQGRRDLGNNICEGDSGSPWAFKSGTEYAAFAVHSGNRQALSWSSLEWATLIRPKLPWIISKTAAIGPALTCEDAGIREFRAVRCREGRWIGYLSSNRSRLGNLARTISIDRSIDPGQLLFGDFDGDGRTDALILRPQVNTGRSDIYVSDSGTHAWQHKGSLPLMANERLLIADFNGDGRDELFRSYGDKWWLARPEDSAWQEINTSGVPVASLSTGDFNCDGRADIFRASSGEWNISVSGRGRWTRINTSNVPHQSLRFGDFDGDGCTDVFRSDGANWRVSFKASGRWTLVNTSQAEPGDLFVGDANGDGKDDILHRNGPNWRYSNAANGQWARLFETGDAESFAIGDFDGDGRTDLLARKSN